VGELENVALNGSQRAFEVGTLSYPILSRRIRIITDSTLGETG